MPESVQQPVPQPQVKATPKSTNWKKVGFTLVFIAACASIILGIYWFFVLSKSSDNLDLTGPVPKVTTKTSTESVKKATESAKKDETADWKTYENDKLGFSIKYPQNWFVYDNQTPPCDGKISGFLFVNQAKISECIFADVAPADLIVRVGETPSAPYGPLPKSTEYDTYTNYDFAGEKGVLNIRTEKSEGPRRKETAIIVNHRNNQYSISYPNLDFKGKHEPIYDKIISTFTFLD